MTVFEFKEEFFLSQGKIIVLLMSLDENEDFNDSSEHVKKIKHEFLTDLEEAEYLGKKKKFYWLYGRILTKISIKKLLKYSGYNDFSEKKIEILSNHPNKPILKILSNQKNLGINFSISHSADRIVAVSGFNEIGIDIEKIRNFPPRLLKKFVNPKDILELFYCIVKSRNFEISQNELFTTIWCMKEAVSKASGLGLKLDLRKIKTQAKSNKIFVRLCNQKVDEIYTINILKEDKYIIAIAEKLNQKS
ncbi:MAG: 4'-phosphopantetheinyl transferase family protein [Candidatus Helarchaeota archaeon]